MQVWKDPVNEEFEKKRNEKEKDPRFKDLNEDPSNVPDGFEWKGNGKPGSKEGSWVNEGTSEKLRNDYHHRPPIQPHWDYYSPIGDARIYPGGVWIWR